MAITLIQSSQIGKVAHANRVYKNRCCFCGHYVFYSEACGHIYTSYVLKCGRGISKLGNLIFCNTPAAHHIMSNHRVVDPCEQCRGMTTPPTRREEQAAGPSPDHPTQGLPAGAMSSSMPLSAGGSSPNRPRSSTPAGAMSSSMPLSAGGSSPNRPRSSTPTGVMSSSMPFSAGGSSPNRPRSSTPAGAVNDYLTVPTANVPPGSSTGTQNMGSNTQSHGMFGGSVTHNGNFFGFFGTPPG